MVVQIWNPSNGGQKTLGTCRFSIVIRLSSELYFNGCTMVKWLWVAGAGKDRNKLMRRDLQVLTFIFFSRLLASPRSLLTVLINIIIKEQLKDRRQKSLKSRSTSCLIQQNPTSANLRTSGLSDFIIQSVPGQTLPGINFRKGLKCRRFRVYKTVQSLGISNWDKFMLECRHFRVT